jgi:hypothetical protein
LPASIKWTVKKFPPIDWQRPIFVIATWVVRLRHVTFIIAAMIPLLLAASLLDPQRPVHTQQHVAQLRAARARDEARIAEQAKAAPASGQVALDFHKLDFRLPPEALESTDRGGYNRWLPAGIKAYDGRAISIEGFMMPTKLENGLVREFLVLANQMTCCYGQTPRFCGFIVARVVGQPLPNQLDRPLVFEGTLHVGDVFQDGYWTALYSMECTSVERSLASTRSRWK